MKIVLWEADQFTSIIDCDIQKNRICVTANLVGFSTFSTTNWIQLTEQAPYNVKNHVL